ncbi:DUF2165 family protein [Agrobacterium salinitolerans]|uniref:DUF2165 family protein n=1 Tax=Agrobacterium salinitolerans TaxID=1183413 RepID=UPI0022B854C1|nr:DUF2165 family protein [Agrobacterium salinitolerans]MCZ7858970.1 DUF2165 family protein [Agrobacterium salinitolerans]
MNPVLISKSILMLGIASWMTVAVINNATDSSTNRFFLGAMLEMRLLENEPAGLGRGLLWRAWAIPGVATALLWGIVTVQAAIAIYLWKAALQLAIATIHKAQEPIEAARATAVRALSGFMALWLAFMVGGFWFGYWIKQGPIQQVHMTLLIISIISTGFVANRLLEQPRPE